MSFCIYLVRVIEVVLYCFGRVTAVNHFYYLLKLRIIMETQTPLYQVLTMLTQKVIELTAENPHSMDLKWNQNFYALFKLVYKLEDRSNET